MDKPIYYIAHAVLYDAENNDFGETVFCGLFKERRNAYRNIEIVMNSTHGNIDYVPQVRVAEVLDCNCNGGDWPECEMNKDLLP